MGNKAIWCEDIFLNKKLHEEVFMLQPKGFVVIGKEDQVYKLKNTFYGLRQASQRSY